MTHHGAGLRQLLTAAGVPPEQQDAILAALVAGRFDDAALTDVERALLAYAEKLTLTPAAVTREDVQRLRDVGLDDRAIHDACAIVAYFAFVNRIADGLGVELERH